MAEEEIILKLEIISFSFCQVNCIQHTCLSAINIIFQSLHAYNSRGIKDIAIWF